MNPLVVQPPPGGAGFDTSLTNGLRIAIRDVIGNASAPDTRPLNMSGLARSLWPDGFNEHWQFVQGPENHDIVYARGREQRIARLGHPDDPRSWFGRSRARVATGLEPDRARHSDAFHGPGISRGQTMVGQLRLDRRDLLLHWAGLDAGDKQMADHLRFTSELIALRWRHPGLRGNGFRVVHVQRRESRAGLSSLGRRRRTRRAQSSSIFPPSTVSTTASAFPAAAPGARSLTATSMRLGKSQRGRQRR